MMQETVCYARVSTLEQAQHGVSIDMQVERLLSYCAAMNLNVVAVIKEEGVSAGKALSTRPGGMRVLDLLKEGHATHVVALKLDRLFRSTEDALKQTTAWDAKGITLHLCDMGGTNINTQSAMGKIMLTLLAAFAEFERTLIAERTSAALAHKKKNRQLYNHVPYGFAREGKQLVPYDAEQKVLKHIFQCRKERLSTYDIADRLNDLGVPAKKGGKWHAATIAHIVNNDLYRDPADNLIPWQPPGKPKEPAEVKFIGTLAGVVKNMGEDDNRTL
jgi:DNA invertase Pin-like site-specific DNA recombinase